MVCPKFNSNVHKLKRPPVNMGAQLFLFWDCERGVSIGELPNVSKLLIMGQSIWLLPLKKKREKVMSTPMSFNN
jgi:hypothetical protein